ncbi:MAG: secretin N-terminal domain-containing protein [Nitrospiria bacterium]
MALATALALGGAGCAAKTRVADQYARGGNWDAAVTMYQEAVAKRPDDARLKAKLDAARAQAAAQHHSRGQALLGQRAVGLAAEEFKQAVTFDPNNDTYRTSLAKALRSKEAEERYTAGVQLLRAEKLADAVESLEKALELDPDLAAARTALKDAAERTKLLEASDELNLTSAQPITLRFQNAKLKEVFDLLAKTSGVNFLFDRDIRDENITIFVKNTSFRDALNLVLTTNNLFMKRVAVDTLLILPKTKQKIDQYQDLLIRTFYLSNTRAKDMVNLLRTMLDTRRVFVNEELNTIVMRDSPDKIRLAEKIIEANDRQVAEVMFEVEVIEIARTNTLKYGWNFFRDKQPGASGTLNVDTNPALTLGTLQDLASGDILVTLPSVLINFIKLDSNAKTLANPRIRVVDNKTAKINIGDKVPINLITTTSAPPSANNTGVPTQTTSTEFKDVGIKLDIKPSIRLNNDVTMDLKLDVTSLGDVDQQANQYRFGTRTTETTINVRDGETVILGGLIRDEERVSLNKIPGLGDLPIIGKLFSSTDKQKVKSDVVLTITPRVIRGLSAPGSAVQSFWSGTEETFTTQPMFSPSDTISRPGTPGESGTAMPLSPANPPPPVSAPPVPPAGQRATPEVFPFPPVPGGPVLPKPSTVR